MKKIRLSPLAIGAFIFVVLTAVLFYVTHAMDLISFTPHELGGDGVQYDALARSLLEHSIYALDGMTPFFEREPGYPVFLLIIYSIFGSANYDAVYITQALLHLFAVSALVVSARKVFPARTAYAAGFILFMFPAVFHGIFALTRESFTLSLLMLFTACILQLRVSTTFIFALLAGISFGWAVLAYVPLLLFPLFLLVALPLSGVRWWNIAITFLVAAAVVAPWGIRNYSLRGEMCLTGCYRAALQWYVRGEQSETITGLEPFSCLYSEYISRNWDGVDQNCSFNAVWHRKWPTGFTGVPADRDIARAGQHKILQNFPNYLWFSVFEVLELHLPYVNGWGRVYNLFAVFTTSVLYLFCAAGLIRLRRHLFAFAPLLAFMLYFTGVFALTDAIARYLLPIIFCYALLAGIGFDWVIGWWKRLRSA